MVLHVIREAAVDLVNKASVVAVHEAGGPTVEPEQLLREAFVSMFHLPLRHHAHAMRAGQRPDNIIDTATLRPLTRATLHEALRESCGSEAVPAARRCSLKPLYVRAGVPGREYDGSDAVEGGRQGLRWRVRPGRRSGSRRPAR